MNFLDTVDWVNSIARSGALDSAERRHIFEFLDDVVSSVRHDIFLGKYTDEPPVVVLQQQLVGCLEEIRRHVEDALVVLEASSARVHTDELAMSLVSYLLHSEAEHFSTWLADGNGGPLYEFAEGEEWEERVAAYKEDGHTSEQWTWLALHTDGHIYCDAYRLAHALAEEKPK